MFTDSDFYYHYFARPGGVFDTIEQKMLCHPHTGSDSANDLELVDTNSVTGFTIKVITQPA